MLLPRKRCVLLPRKSYFLLYGAKCVGVYFRVFVGLWVTFGCFVLGSTDILMPMLLLTFNFRTVSPLLFLVRRLAHS
jgi:hypothetical protein